MFYFYLVFIIWIHDIYQKTLITKKKRVKTLQFYEFDFSTLFFKQI